jgi:hypothetical protein
MHVAADHTHCVDRSRVTYIDERPTSWWWLSLSIEFPNIPKKLDFLIVHTPDDFAPSEFEEEVVDNDFAVNRGRRK